MRTEIVFEDKDILVIYKPSGIATQSAKPYEKDVVSELKVYLKGGFVGVVHRLDQPVEGLLVFAKNQAAAAKLSAGVQSKTDEASFSKDYLAVVAGIPEDKSGRLENLMVKSQGNRAEIIGDADKGSFPEAKRASLTYEVLVCDDMASLIRVHLETGRFHQIRAQLAAAGHPILGDKKYGDDRSSALSNELSVRGVALCAERISFIHPVSKQRMDFTKKPAGAVFARFE